MRCYKDREVPLCSLRSLLIQLSSNFYLLFANGFRNPPSKEALVLQIKVTINPKDKGPSSRTSKSVQFRCYYYYY